LGRRLDSSDDPEHERLTAHYWPWHHRTMHSTEGRVSPSHLLVGLPVAALVGSITGLIGGALARANSALRRT